MGFKGVWVSGVTLNGRTSTLTGTVSMVFQIFRICCREVRMVGQDGCTDNQYGNLTGQIHDQKF